MARVDLRGEQPPRGDRQGQLFPQRRRPPDARPQGPGAAGPEILQTGGEIAKAATTAGRRSISAVAAALNLDIRSRRSQVIEPVQIVASIMARSSGVTSGITPNQSRNAGRAWFSSMPSPLTVRLPRARAAASS